jgi:hypothetical protein
MKKIKDWIFKKYAKQRGNDTCFKDLDKKRAWAVIWENRNLSGIPHQLWVLSVAPSSKLKAKAAGRKLQSLASTVIVCVSGSDQYQFTFIVMVNSYIVRAQ